MPTPDPSPEHDHQPSWTRRRFTAYALVTSLLSLFLSLVIAEWVIQYQDRYISNSERMDPGLLRFDSSLGWRLAPGWSGLHHHYDYDVVYHIDESGFRAGTPEKKTGQRIAVLGDSFTFGLGVADSETFVSLLNVNNEIQSTFLNLGVPGYSTDQEYLLFKQIGKSIDVDAVLLIVYMANDLFDNQLQYPLQADHAKPRFRLNGANELVLENTPVPRTSKPAAARSNSLTSIVLGDDKSANPALTRIFGSLHLAQRLGLFQTQANVPDTVFQHRFQAATNLFLALVQSLNKTCVAHDVKLSIALLPGSSYIEQPDSLSAMYQDYLRRTLVAELGHESLMTVIDLAAAMRINVDGIEKPLYFPNDGHLTTLGHRYIASTIADILDKQGYFCCTKH